MTQGEGKEREKKREKETRPLEAEIFILGSPAWFCRSASLPTPEHAVDAGGCWRGKERAASGRRRFRMRLAERASCRGLLPFALSNSYCTQCGFYLMGTR